ncbi:MAG: helix-turn-helix transcriptional regulator [Candidatus Obscuribacterales bacterium]|nr:helix-turn-helix transcriptional regulator [Candidatus Obscuribacterales bacterium]
MKHNSSNNDIMDALIAARKSRNLSQSALARSLDIPQSYISRLEAGQIDLRLSSLVDLARFFNLELMLVPTSMVSTVNSLLHADMPGEQEKPIYQLDDIEQC